MTARALRLLVLGVTAGLPALASAQPPAVPAAGASAPSPGGAVPPGGLPALAQGPAAVDPSVAPPDDDIHRNLRNGPRPPATGMPSTDVPAGVVRVHVIDPSGAPVAGADVLLNALGARGASRDMRNERTNANGVTEFTGLTTGSGETYRVKMEAGGATYATTPFNLPMDHGYAATIRRLPTTQDETRVFLMGLETFLELKEERLHIVQKATLLNMGEATYVFPEEGKLVGLPAGYLAFQSHDVMTDQRFEPVEEQGFKLHGSLAPGRVRLSWGYDVPASANLIDLHLPVPFIPFQLQVVSQALPGMQLEVTGFPPAESEENDGSNFLVTQLRRSPEDPPMTDLHIMLRGVPGPGPARWVALLLALVLVSGGVFLAARASGRESEQLARILAEKRKLLVAAIAVLDASLTKAAIGPKFHAQERDRLLTDLAVVLRQEEARGRVHAARKPA